MKIFSMSVEDHKNKASIHTATEINQQPSTWKKTIAQVQAQQEALTNFINKVITQPDFDIVLCGAGTSEFVGNALFSYVNSSLNYRVKSFATTDLVAYPANYLSKTKPTLLISFGRSGNSPESVGAVEVANVVCDNIYHLCITCNSNGALAKLEGESNVYTLNLTEETHDQSFAMTSSFSNMYLACLAILRINNLSEIETSLNEIIINTNNLLVNDYNYFEALVTEFNFNRIVYLGAASLKGIAQESALKMLELSAGDVVTMYDTPLGFRHGPKSIINDDTLCVVFMSTEAYARQYELDLIKEMSKERKANKILVVDSYQDDELANLVDYYYSFNNESKFSNGLLALEYIVVAQLIALFKSLALDITPDNPCPSGEVNRVVKGVTIYPYQ